MNRSATTVRTHPRPSSELVWVDLAKTVLLLGVLWVAYTTVRGITAGDLVKATENARALIDLQRSLGLPSEAAIQAAVLDDPWILRGANLYYIGVHFPITIAFMAWAWRTDRSKFTRVRNTLIATTTVGLAIHVAYPLKPPRMMAGFVDTAAVIGPNPYELGISEGANQLAAMPSLHIGWALLIAFGVVWISSSPLRWLVLAHPIVTLAVVVLTANHYWTDAIVAAAIVTAAWQLTLLSRTKRSRAAGDEREADDPDLAPEHRPV